MFELSATGARQAEIDAGGVQGPWQALEEAPLPALRTLIAQSALDFPADLPPPAAGIYGYLSYETVGQVEKLPQTVPDPIGVPLGLFVRPRTVIVFDGVKQELLLVTPVRPDGCTDARTAYEAAVERSGKPGRPWTGQARCGCPLPMQAPSMSVPSRPT